jgi:lycopene beta-cyclase
MDYIIVGGGLAGGLAALALAQAGRAANLTLLEGEATLGGNHTWSFHDTDLDDEGRTFVSPMVARRWPRHEVRFPGRARTIAAGYSAISSAGFAEIVGARLQATGARVRLGARAVAVAADQVRLADGTVLRGDMVVDARGPTLGSNGERCGFQKFVGLELELDADGPWATPVLMDATLPQTDGYRFVYVLPFSSRRVLVEDTYYSDDPRLDHEACEREVLAYARRNGAVVVRVLRREVGVLPLPIEQPLAGGTTKDTGGAGPLKIGYRGGFFHAVTGYSVPLAVPVALAVARARSASEAHAALAVISGALAPQQRFGRLLNRLMFVALPPPSRWRAFERFYRLPEATIARFYAGRSTWGDRARVLVGRPPAGISWSRALGAWGRSSWREQA